MSFLNIYLCMDYIMFLKNSINNKKEVIIMNYYYEYLQAYYYCYDFSYSIILKKLIFILKSAIF